MSRLALTIRYGTARYSKCVYVQSAGEKENKGLVVVVKLGRGRQVGNARIGMDGLVIGGGRSKVKTGRGSSKLVDLMGNAKAFVTQVGSQKSRKRKKKRDWTGRKGVSRKEVGPGVWFSRAGSKVSYYVGRSG